MSVVLVVLLVVLLVGAVGTGPYWNHSREWGYGPSGGIFTVLLIVVLLMFFGVIPKHF